MSTENDVAQDPRYASVRAMLHKRYNGVIPVTDEMVQAVLDALDEEG
jgi:hypothetical protein